MAGDGLIRGGRFARYGVAAPRKRGAQDPLKLLDPPRHG